jgi:type I restriction enzyme S subunit
MSDWQEASLADLADYINGRAIKPEECSGGSGIPVIRIKQINDPQAIDDCFCGDNLDEKNIVRNGDLLFSWSATLKTILWQGPAGAINQHIFKVLPRPGIDKTFLHYLIDNSIPALAEESHGSTMKHIKKSALSAFHLQIPTLPEQKKIAEILSGIDKTLDRTKRRTATLELLEVATRNELFEYLTKELHSERRLSEIALAPITYGIVQPGDYDPNGIILVRGQDYLQGWGKKEFFKVSPELSGKYKRSLIKPKDVLICIAGANTGDSSITPKWISNANITQTTARVRADTSIISPEFLLEFTKSRVGRERLMNYVKGSAQPGLNLSDIEKVVIPIPGNDQQQRISNSMDSLKKLILSSRKKEDYLKQIKKGLSSDLLSGRKRVSI